MCLVALGTFFKSLLTNKFKHLLCTYLTEITMPCLLKLDSLHIDKPLIDTMLLVKISSRVKYKSLLLS